MRYLLPALLMAVVLFGVLQTGQSADDDSNIVTVYSSQKEHLIKPVLELFTEQTGINVQLTTGGKSDLVTRMQYEGAQSPADVFLTADIVNIYRAKQKGLLQPVTSNILEAQIPENLRDREGYWYGLTVRSRSIFYHKDAVKPSEIQTYEELADPKWRGKLLIRSSSNVYNQSLMASMIAHHGEQEALRWAKGIVANMARPPQGGDSDQLRALAAGEGEIAVANTYYFARMFANEVPRADQLVQEKVGIILPNQSIEEASKRGAHINIRGGGVAKYAPHKSNAIALLEYLASDAGQAFFANENLEYPIDATLYIHPVVAGWGELERDDLSLEVIGELQQRAVELMDQAGWK